MKEIVLPDDGDEGFDADLEARLVALILGEASEFEREALERLMAKRPEVADWKRGLEVVHGLVEDAVEAEHPEETEWKLSPERRAHVMQTLGIGKGSNGPSREPNGNGNEVGAVREVRIRRASRKVMWAAAACLVVNLVIFALLVGTGMRSKKRVTRGEGQAVTWMLDSSDSEAVGDVRIEGAARTEESVIRREVPPAAPMTSLPGSERFSRSVRGETEKRAQSALAELRDNLGGGERDEKETATESEAGRKLMRDALGDLRGEDFGGGGISVETKKVEPLVAGNARQAREAKEPDPFGGGEEEEPGADESGGVLPPLPAVVSGGKGNVPEPELKLEEDGFGTGLGWGDAGGEARGKGKSGAADTAQAEPESPDILSINGVFRGGQLPSEDASAAAERPPGEGGGVHAGGVLTIDPNDQRARQELEYLDSPIRTNPGLNSEHAQDVDKVRRHLYTAEGYKDLGLYDEAVREYRETLRTDPHNTAARRGMEGIEKLKSDHYRSSYDEGRARLLSQVDSAWDLAVPPPVSGGRSGVRPRRGAPLTGSEGINEKMKEIVIPELNLENTTVDEAMEILRQKVEELDDVELDPQKKGISFVVRKPRLQGGAGGAVDAELDAEGGLGAVDPGQARVKELKLKNVPVQTALQYIADQARLRYKVDEHAVTLLPLGSGEGDDVLTRKWKVPPTFVTDLEGGAEGGDAEADPFGGDDTGLGGGSLRPRRPLIDVLKDSGIDFPPGSSAQYIPSTSTLIVSNTPSNLDLVDQLSQSLHAAVPTTREIDPHLFRRFEDPKAEKTEETWQKLRYLKVPDLALRNVTVAEALRALQAKVNVPGIELRAQDPFGLGFGEGGFNKVDPRSIRIGELKLEDERLGTALYRVANLAGLDLQVSGAEVVLKPQEENSRLVTSTWHVDPKVMQGLREPQDHSSGEPDPFGNDESAADEIPVGGLVRPSRPLIDELKDAGINFPPGSSVRYLPKTSTLIVKNDPANLDLVDQLFATVAMGMSEEMTREEEIRESVETRVADEPFSTFSLHVSDVSFKLAKATLDKGQWPAAGQIRVEEFVNAFDYDDPTPRMEEKVACRLEQAAHPFMQQRNLLRISMRTAALGRAGGTPLRLTVLLDNSGSMERADRAESVQRAFDLLTAQMNAADAITLISFARTPRLLADRIPGNEARELSKLVARTPSEGGTNLEQALRLGLSKAREQKVKGGINRIILLTDGAANLGNAKPDDLARLVETMREQGIAFDACGVGADGLNDEILESLTRKGDGRYYFLDRPEDADAGFARQIAGALRPAARNVKVQVEFNPRRVGYYKLYGFDKHLLEKEDFRDDRVDAAEMAAEEAGNAVYHMEVRADGEGDLGTVSVRFQDTATGSMVERLWTIPYEPAAPPLGEATPSMKLAGSAALFGERLNGSPIGERVRLSELVKLVGPLASDYPGSSRVTELVEMVAKARGIGN